LLFHSIFTKGKIFTLDGSGSSLLALIINYK
jgi:hypothetical protein